jgi:hypothetical protein
MFCLITVKRRDQLLALDRRMGMLIQGQGGISLTLHLILNVAQTEVALIARTRNYRVLHRSAGIRLV